MSLVRILDLTYSKAVNKIIINSPAKHEKEYFELVDLIREGSGDMTTKQVVERIKPIYAISKVKDSTLFKGTHLACILLTASLFGFLASISYVSF